MKTLGWILVILTAVLLAMAMSAPAWAQTKEQLIAQHCPAGTAYCLECFEKHDTLREQLGCVHGIRLPPPPSPRMQALIEETRRITNERHQRLYGHWTEEMKQEWIRGWLSVLSLFEGARI